MIHINRFIDKIKAVESKRQGDAASFPMTVREAKDLHGDITKLLLHLQQLQQARPAPDPYGEPPVIEVEMTGGNF